MRRINAILKYNIFTALLKKIETAEETCIYCRHGIDHLFDTARICYIINLENGYGFDKEIIYAAALLHDIGRYEEYKNNISHNEASGKIADEILFKCGFSELEKKIIVEAIFSHREIKEDISLGALLYKGDKLSRKCFFCEAEDKCYWSEDKKNFGINLY